MARNRLLYFLILCASCYFVYMKGGLAPWLIFELVLAAPAVSFIFLLIGFASLRYEQSVSPAFVQKGEASVLTLELVNRSIIFIPMVKAKLITDEAAFPGFRKPVAGTLPPYGREKLEIPFQCLLAGRFRAGAEYCELYDFLGIFKIRKRYWEPVEFTIAPRKLGIEYVNLSQGFSFRLTQSGRYGPDRTGDNENIRKYGAGDGMRSVHWKLSAKKSELMVREKQPEPDTRAVILCDLHRGGSETDKAARERDAIIEYAVSIGRYSAEKCSSLTLVYADGPDRIAVKAESKGEFRKIYDTICGFEMNGGLTCGELMQSVTGETEPGCTIALITPSPSGEPEECADGARLCGFRVFVIDAGKPLVPGGAPGNV